MQLAIYNSVILSWREKVQPPLPYTPTVRSIPSVISPCALCVARDKTVATVVAYKLCPSNGSRLVQRRTRLLDGEENSQRYRISSSYLLVLPSVLPCVEREEMAKVAVYFRLKHVALVITADGSERKGRQFSVQANRTCFHCRLQCRGPSNYCGRMLR